MKYRSSRINNEALLVMGFGSSLDFLKKLFLGKEDEFKSRLISISQKYGGHGQTEHSGFCCQKLADEINDEYGSVVCTKDTIASFKKDVIGWVKYNKKESQYPKSGSETMWAQLSKLNDSFPGMLDRKWFAYYSKSRVAKKADALVVSWLKSEFGINVSAYSFANFRTQNNIHRVREYRPSSTERKNTIKQTGKPSNDSAYVCNKKKTLLEKAEELAGMFSRDTMEASEKSDKINSEMILVKLDQINESIKSLHSLFAETWK